MGRTFLLFTIIFLFVIFINLGIFVTNALLFPKEKTRTEVLQAQEKLKKVIQNPTPPYAPDWLTWTIGISQDPQSISQAKLNTYLYSDGETKVPPLPLVGQEWVNTTTFKTQKELKGARDVTSYYLQHLNNNGWRYSDEIQGKTFRGVAANGPQGNVASFIKATSTDLHLFVLSVHQSTQNCPCTITTRVFVSTPFSIRSVIN